jgi:predicted ArsR family transcriptional regulator
MLAQRGPYYSSARTREKLVAGLRARPGSRRADLARETGLPWGTVAHHLRAMEARGELAVERAGRTVRYWLKDEGDAGRLQPPGAEGPEGPAGSGR